MPNRLKKGPAPLKMIRSLKPIPSPPASSRATGSQAAHPVSHHACRWPPALAALRPTHLTKCRQLGMSLFPAMHYRKSSDFFGGQKPPEIR
jgi:hypothetical protein